MNDSNFDDYYDILGVNTGATSQEIQNAYKKLEQQYKSIAAKAKTNLKRATKAFRVLSDKKRRKKYDSDLGMEECQGRQWDGRGGLIGAIMFMFPEVYGEWKPKERDPPVEHEVFVTLEEVNTGCVRKIKLSRRRFQLNDSLRMQEDVFNVKIKPGVEDGARIVFPRESHQSRCRIAGDIVFIVRVLPHDKFERIGNDIRYKLSIDLWQAIEGTVISVPTLQGPCVTVHTTGGKIQNGSIKRLRGLGLSILGDRRKRGDLLVQFDVIVPEELFENA